MQTRPTYDASAGSAPLSDCPIDPPKDSRGFAIGKRLIDLMIAVPMVLLVLPVAMLVVALVHTLVSRGPLFYRQMRCGRHGVIFSIVKFRTMDPVSEDQRIKEQDPVARVFKGGHFVRFSKIDEIPQFINVLRGEMSVVGPRPHHLQDCREFESRVAGYAHRVTVKPGITGLAQIREYAGEFRWNCTNSRVQADLEYIQTRTLLGDVVLIFRTFSTVAWKCQSLVFSRLFQVRSVDSKIPVSFESPDILKAELVSEQREQNSRKAA